MQSQAIDIDNIDEGVDRKQLKLLKARFLCLNQERYDRTQAALSERQQLLLSVLPLLFHVNHPMLPGYTSPSTPAGLFDYQPTAEDLRLAKIVARSFSYQRDLTAKAAAIDALYVMGSIGTIAQNEQSDLDIWVCRSTDLTAPQIAELEKKCELISLWAEQQVNLDVHFFVMHSDDFKAAQLNNLSTEASGSAQHYLLLDEFYRTALWLGGKLPLWWFVPANQEKNYESYSQKLLSKRFLKASELIDFGAVATIPANEFIGAGIWQLYKAIESPYKSVLKLLLLEVYTHATGTNNCEPLALRFKRAIYKGPAIADQLDPYLMVYRAIEDHLLLLQQHERLDLVRRCFYFKVNKPLSQKRTQAKKSWRRQLLEELVADWGWSLHQLHMLDNRNLWKAPHVINERSLLVSELSHCYRLITQLNKNTQEDAAISSDELLVLGRKLHAAFERKAGKVEWINPGISRDLGETSLCFTQDSQSKSWQLLRGSQADINLRASGDTQISVEPIRRAQGLLELIFWCHINGLLRPQTKLDLTSQNLSLSNTHKQQLLHMIQHWLPEPNPKVDHSLFTRPASIQKLLLVFNLGIEPQAELLKKGQQLLSAQNDPLGFSGFKASLVLSVDIVQLNSWGELVCRHYASDALVNCLLHYLRLFPCTNGRPFSRPLPDLKVHCFSGQGGNIAQRISELWQALIACYYSHPQGHNNRYLLAQGKEYLLIQILQQQPQIFRFNNYQKLLEKLSQPQTDFSPLIIDRHCLSDQPLAVMNSVIKPQSISIFLQRKGDSADLTLVDDKGSFISTQSPFYHQAALLRPLVSFIQAVLQRQSLEGVQHIPGEINLYELHPQRPQGYRLAPLQLEANHPDALIIKAVAEFDLYNQLRFSIFCDQEEFSALTHGEDIFVQVATYIMQRRHTSERYPGYISDLDLSLCRDTLGQQTGLQLAHYLHIKAELERKLNLALSSL
jgi:adenylate cyclase, class 1